MKKKYILNIPFEYPGRNGSHLRPYFCRFLALLSGIVPLVREQEIVSPNLWKPSQTRDLISKADLYTGYQNPTFRYLCYSLSTGPHVCKKHPDI